MESKRKKKEDIEFRKLILKLLSLVCLLIFCYFVYKYDPRDWDYMSCPSMYMGHLKCPFCGNLRAFHYLFNGDIMEALARNSVGLICTILAVLMFYIPDLGKNIYLRIFLLMAIATWTLARVFVKYEFFNDLLDMFGL